MRKRVALLLFLVAAVLVALLLAGIQQSRLFRVDISGHHTQSSLTGTLPLGVGSAGQAGNVSDSELSTLLIKPHYTAIDATGRRWDLTADRADQASMLSSTIPVSGSVLGAKPKSKNLIGGTGHVILYNVSGTFADPNLQAVQASKGLPPLPPETMRADTANYVQLINQLTLVQNVVITGRGLTLTTPLATAWLVSHTAAGNQGVVITGFMGRKNGGTAHGGYHVSLSGEQFSIDQAAGHVTLIGNVVGHLVPQP